VRRAVRPAAIFGGTFAFLSLPAMLLGASQGTPLLSLLATEVAIFAGFGLFGFIVKLLGDGCFLGRRVIDLRSRAAPPECGFRSLSASPWGFGSLRLPV